jgi:uncharacterized membrane protein
MSKRAEDLFSREDFSKRDWREEANGRRHFATGINDADQIVGYFNNGSGTHGFFDNGGTYTTLNYPGVSSHTEAFGINDLGQVVGFYLDNSPNSAGLISLGYDAGRPR